MELGQPAVLLSVIVESGMWGAEPRKQVKMPSGSLTRNVQNLSGRPGEGKGKTGLKLISQIPDPMDGRALQLTLTQKGRDLAVKLSELMKG